MDLAAAVAQGMVRVPTHIVSTICDDRGEEPTYNGVSMSELIEGDGSLTCRHPLDGDQFDVEAAPLETYTCPLHGDLGEDRCPRC